MTEHDGARLRRERQEDMTTAINEALPAELKKALPGALEDALPAALETALWGDMRPARKWVDMRAYFEGAVKEHERKVKQLEGLQKRSVEIGWDLLKTALIHLLISGSLATIAWQVIFHGAKP